MKNLQDTFVKIVLDSGICLMKCRHNFISCVSLFAEYGEMQVT
jgi:hypothetical protein